MKIHTSKIMLILWILAGAAVLAGWLAWGREVNVHLAVIWVAGLGGLIWNRVDSRKSGAYRFELRGPQGTALNVHKTATAEPAAAKPEADAKGD